MTYLFVVMLLARRKSIISDFVVWARVRRQFEAVLIKGNGTTLEEDR